MVVVNVGIIGLGNIGHRFGCSAQGDPLSHSSAYALQPEVNVVLGVDPDAEARKHFLTKFPHAVVVADLAEVPAGIRLDLVSVCSPTPEHLAGVRLALRHGSKVVLCEKPLAESVSDAEEIVHECASHNVELVANYSRRWTPMLEVLFSATREDGLLGTPRGAVFRYNGGLNHNGTHWIDLLIALFGPPAEAYSLDGDCIENDPSESIVMQWDNGFRATLLSVHARGYSIGEAEFWGEKGILRFRDGGQLVELQQVADSAWPGYTCLGPPQILTREGLKGHMLEAIKESIRLVREGGESKSPGSSGLEAMKVVSLARRNRIR